MQEEALIICREFSEKNNSEYEKVEGERRAMNLKRWNTEKKKEKR